MNKISLFKNVFGIALLIGGLGVALLVMGVPETKAGGFFSKVDVVVMDCGENNEKFEVNDISSTEDVGVALGDDCAVALQGCLAAGYRIVPGGGGAIFDSVDDDEHVLYTLVRRGKRFSF